MPERGDDAAVAFAIGWTSGDVFFAVPLREVHLPLLAGDDLDNGVGDVLLGIGGHALGPPFVVEDDRAVLLHLVLLRDGRLLVGIDVFDVDLLRRVLILLQSILETLDLVFLLERQHLERRVKLRDDVAALIREAELFVGGQIPSLVLARTDVVDGDENGQHHEHADAGERPVSRLPAGEHRRDLAPLPQRVGQHADEAAPRQVIRPLFLRRKAETDSHRNHHERGPQPADET